MVDAPEKPVVAKPRLARRLSTSLASAPSYRVSKAQSLRIRAYDKRIDAAEAKAAQAQKSKAGKKAEAM